MALHRGRVMTLRHDERGARSTNAARNVRRDALQSESPTLNQPHTPGGRKSAGARSPGIRHLAQVADALRRSGLDVGVGLGQRCPLPRLAAQ